MALYRCRWQIELLFKELKSHNRLKAFATRQKAIAEGLIWASLLALLVKRRLALLEAVAHRALTEIRERLEWAADYLAKNACRTKQRKSIQNRTLEGVLNGLAA